MKTFDNCFSGSGGAEWLLQYLKSHESFGSDVSRKKALLLLNKLFKSGVFEEVKLSRNMRNKQEVQENRLYRFLPLSPSKMKMTRLPLAPRNDAGINQSVKKNVPIKPLGGSKSENKSMLGENSHMNFPNKLARKISFKRDKPVKEEVHPAQDSPPLYHIMKRVLTTREIRGTWKDVYLEELKKTLNLANLEDFMDTDLVDGDYVMHNCIYLNKSGMVTNIQPEDQLPHWVLSAMKCLARWPEPPEPGLPSYPGFERDVFTVVKDYFLGLDEPLVPYVLYDVITRLFVMSCDQEAPEEHEEECEDASTTLPSLWTSASLENIILNLTRKYMDSPDLRGRDSAFSLEDLRGPGSVQRLRFDHQEDLRCAGLVDHSYTDYDLSAYPSTDGMDKLHHSYRRRPQSSHGGMRGLPTPDSVSVRSGLLSRTTHSAGEAVSDRPKVLSKVGRQFDSTPNLKVSRYETAFGPDNKTVTKVYFQKGISSERLNTRRESESVPDQRETCFGPGLDRSQTSSQHDKSYDSLAGPRVSHRRNMQRGPTLGRSKSFVDIDPNSKAYSGHLFVAPANGMVAKKSYQEKNRSSSFYNSTDSLTSFNKGMRNLSDSSSVRELERNSSMNVATYHDPPRSYNSFNEASRHVTAGQVSEPSSPAAEVTSPLSDIFEDVPSFGPGYRPVLDAARSRPHRSFSSSDAYSLNQSQRHISYARPDRVTSTPLEPTSPLCYKPARYQSFAGSSLDDVTPLVGTRGRHIGRGQSYTNYQQSRVSSRRASASLRMVLLLLPPASRRRLHTLFKMMMKMVANPNLCLDPTQTMSSLVLGTFYRAVVRPLDERDFDEHVALQLVSFMLDQYEEILAPPPDLKVTVSDRLKVMQKPQKKPSFFSLFLDGLRSEASDKVLSTSQCSGV